MLLILIILLIVALFAGGLGYNRYGYSSIGPFGLILIVILVLWAAGALN